MGIPNHAFYLAAVAIGKPAWEVAGRIWYVTLTQRLRPDADFTKCALETISVARDYFDNETAEKVGAAWVSVGVVSWCWTNGLFTEYVAPPAESHEQEGWCCQAPEHHKKGVAVAQI